MSGFGFPIHGASTTIAGTLTSAANSSYRIEFFANDIDPLALPAEGQQYLGFANVNTNANGTVLFNQSFNVVLTNGRLITATATDSARNTSEFSAGIPIPTTA